MEPLKPVAKVRRPAERRPPPKPTRTDFAALGTRVMAVSKEELERREKEWQQRRKRKVR